MPDIENLWRKRLGLTKPPLEYIYDRLHNKAEWTSSDYGYYNVYHPEYTIEIVSNEEDLDAEFYAYAMANSNTSYDDLSIKYQTTTLDSYQLVILDGGRLQIPTPEWGYVCHDKYGLHNKYFYKYYVAGSKRYRLLNFLYDPQNGDHRYAFTSLKEVVLFFQSEEEHLAFEAFLESHQELVKEKISAITRFDHIQTETKQKTDVCIERLHTGYALNEMLTEWRRENL